AWPSAVPRAARVRWRRTPALAPKTPAAFGSLLFDLETDPGQTGCLTDPDLEHRMATLLVQGMRDNDAPPDQYQRLGLPPTGEVRAEHLVLTEQADQQQEPPDPELLAALAATELGHRTVEDLLSDPESRQRLRAVLGDLADAPLPPEARGMTIVQIATVTTGMLPPAALRGLLDAFADAPDDPHEADGADGAEVAEGADGVDG